MSPRRKTPPSQPRVEPNDVAVRGVALGMVGLFMLVLVSAAIVGGMLFLIRGENPQPHPSALETRDIKPPAPQLETSATGDRARIEGAAKARLHGYAWVDQNAGIARIPIEEAMRRTVAMGWNDPPDNGLRGEALQIEETRKKGTAESTPPAPAPGGPASGAAAEPQSEGTP